MSTSSLRTRWPRWPIAGLAVLAVLALAAPAYASGGGGGGGGGGGTSVLRAITFSPASVIGGGGDTATVTFSAPVSEGAVVDLASSNTAVAGFQENVLNSDEVVVQPGHSSATFAVVTTAVPASTAVTITASSPISASVSAAITVNPGTPPRADTVQVTTFEWKHGIQTIEASSSNPSAVLNVFDQDGTFTGITLTSEGGGKFQDQREEVFPPDQPIVVESNFGGSATATAAISN